MPNIRFLKCSAVQNLCRFTAAVLIATSALPTLGVLPALAESQTLSVSSAPAAAADTSAAESLSPTLVELTEFAESRHAGYLARLADFAAEKENENISFSALLPQVSAQFSEDLQNSEKPWGLSFSATQVLVDFTASNQWRAAQEQTKTATANLELAKHNLRRDVILAWLNAHLAADVLELVVARQKTLQEQLNRVKLLVDAGRGTQTDVLSARAGLANARSQWEQAKHDLADAENTVMRYTGVVAAPATLAVVASELPPPQPLADWQAQVEKNSLSALAMRQQVKYLERLLSAAKTAIFPKVEFSSGLHARGGTSNPEKSFGLVVAQRLFTGGNLTAQQRRVLALLDAARWRLTDVMRQEEQEVRRLHGQMRANQGSIAALEDSAAAAAALLSAIIVGYNNGVRVAEDVIRAEEDFFDARLQLRREVFQYLTNFVVLKTLAAQADNSFVAQIQGYFMPEKGGEASK